MRLRDQLLLLTMKINHGNMHCILKKGVFRSFEGAASQIFCEASAIDLLNMGGYFEMQYLFLETDPEDMQELIDY